MVRGDDPYDDGDVDQHKQQVLVLAYKLVC
jgi:hypothetical protein